jgi:large subunit ribosomal protein L21
MFAIVEISGEQFKIDGSTKKLRVPLMAGAEAGKKVKIDNILLTQADGGKVSLGGKATIEATVAGESKGDKLIVFKKKRRKGYRVKNGHTQRYTELSIDKFSI